MSESSPLLSLYLEINILLAIAFCLYWSTEKTCGLLGWRFSFLSQLQTVRLFLLLVLITPLLLRLSPPLVPEQLSETIQRPVEVITTAFSESDTNNEIASLIEKKPGLRVTYLDIFIGLFWLVFVYLAIRLGVRTVNLHAIISRSHQWKRMGRLSVYISDEISVPFSTRVFLRSQIVIPEKLLASENYLLVAIAHEGQHLRNGDTSWEAILELLSLVFFCNPVIYPWKSTISNLQELACDEKVLSVGKISKADYGKCLLHVVEQFSQSSFKPIASSCMAGKSIFKKLSKTMLERRLVMLSGKTELTTSKLKALAYRGALVVALALSGLTLASCNGTNRSTKADDYNLPYVRQITYETEIIRFSSDRDPIDWEKIQKDVSNDKGITAATFEDYLAAFNKVGNAEVVAAPKVVTGDEQMALITWGTPPPQLKDEKEVSNDKLAFSLELLPKIINNNQIEHNIDFGYWLSTNIESDGIANGRVEFHQSENKWNITAKPQEIVLLPLTQTSNVSKEHIGTSNHFLLLVKAQRTDTREQDKGSIVMSLSWSYKPPEGDDIYLQSPAIFYSGETRKFGGQGKQSPFQVELTPTTQKDGNVLLNVKVLERTGDEYQIIAEPNLLMRNKVAQIINLTSNSGGNYHFNFTAIVI